jgi:hypothetical protein
LIIGPAEDFWRLRMTRMDPTDDLDFEWHDDILWREPQVHLEPGEPAYVVEAVSAEAGLERIVPLAAFAEEDSARAFLDEVRDDLLSMTRSQFEAARFPQ